MGRPAKPYASKYGAGDISAGNYLAEFICERIAKKEKVGLAHKFWQTDRWKKIYQRQVVAAAQLLKEHSCKQIMDALNHFRGKNIHSLGLKKPIVDIIKNCLTDNPSKLHDQPLVEDFGWDLDEHIEAEAERKPRKRSNWETL